jgi:hypothetical protein
MLNPFLQKRFTLRQQGGVNVWLAPKPVAALLQHVRRLAPGIKKIPDRPALETHLEPVVCVGE